MALFGNKPEKHEEVQMSNSTNTISKGTVIKGDIETFGNIRIDGKLIGGILSKSKLYLGAGGVIEGNIVAQNAEIEGEVIGTLQIQDVLTLRPTAVIKGDIYTDKLVVESGAKFNGTCTMGEKNTQPHVNGSKSERGAAAPTVKEKVSL